MNPSRQLTLFTEDSLDHANPSPWLVTGKDGTTIDSCGLSFRGWSERLARVGSWLRTYLASFPLPPMTSARIWSVSATASGFGILKLWLSGHRTGEHGCSLLPTPRSATGMAYPLRKPENIRNTSRLEDFVAIYPTPRCCDGKRSSGANRSEFYRMWATPKAGDAITGATARTSGRPLEKTTHLAAQVHLFPTPTANDAKCNGTASQQNRNSEALNVVAGGSLNPEWVEVLMGFPRGWTEIGRAESPE